MRWFFQKPKWGRETADSWFAPPLLVAGAHVHTHTKQCRTTGHTEARHSVQNVRELCHVFVLTSESDTLRSVDK